MSKENISTTSEQNLNKYGVWVKKKATEPKKEFDFFGVGGSAQEPAEADLQATNESLDFFSASSFDEGDELEVLNFDEPALSETGQESEELSRDFGLSDSQPATKENFFAETMVEPVPEEVRLEPEFTLTTEDTIQNIDDEIEPIDEIVIEKPETKTAEEQDMSFDTDELEEIDLDDFLSDTSPLESSSVDEPSAGVSENIEVASESIAPSSPEVTESSGVVDLDISFDAPAAPTTSSESSSSSAFDDMLDELTSSSDDMVAVSLDDFIDDFEPPKKPEEEEELQERPEPKTTIEEFSLDSIKTSSSGVSLASTPSAPSKTETASSGSMGVSSSDFEDISLDDFFSDTSVDTTAPAPARPAEKEQRAAPTGINLAITEETDSVGVQDVGISGANEEIDDISLFGNGITEVPAASEKASLSAESATETSAEPEISIGEIDLEPSSVDVGFADEFDIAEDFPELADDFSELSSGDSLAEPASDLAEFAAEPAEIQVAAAPRPEPTLDEPLAFDTGLENQEPLAHQGDVGDLTAIVEEKEEFLPSLPDFEINETENTTIEEDYAMENTRHEELEPITKNEQFDDVNALTADLLDTPSGQVGFASTEASSNVATDNTSELLMKLVDEIASMKTEIASLKDELLAVRDTPLRPSLEAQETALSEPTGEGLEDIEVPTIDSFDVEGPAPSTEEPELTEGLDFLASEPEKSEGFFSDDAIDETIALTGDELNNILNTADFVEEQNPDEFDIPEVLNLDETFSVDDEVDSDSSSELEMEEIDMETFTNDDTLQVHDDLPNEELPDFVVEPITTLDVDTDFLDNDKGQNSELELEAPEVDLEIPTETLGVATGIASELVATELEPIEAHPIEENAENLLDIGEEIFPEELLASEEPVVSEPILATDETENFDTDDLDTIVEDIPLADLDVQSLDAVTASSAEQKISTVHDELRQPTSATATLPIDMKEEIKSVLTYMDQLLESLPEEKIEEFAKSEYFETYKKLFDELGIS